MDNENVTQVPYIVYESEQSRNERTIKRLVIALVIAVVLLFVSNIIWLKEWTKYDYVGNDTDSSTTYYQDGEGFNSINTGTQGDIDHGADNESSSTHKDKSS